MPKEIHETALEWAKAIESRFPETVLKLYHPEGSLWGTLSPTLRQGHAAIYEYFVKFLQWEDLKCEFTDGLIRLHEDYAFFSGSYVFTWTARAKKVVVPARFSFVYKKENGEWLIMEHHSSLFPELPFRIRKYIRKEHSS
jgi:uncharacterized protein (TIGR02246 family)